MKYLLVIAVLLSFTAPDKAQAVEVRGGTDCGTWLTDRKEAYVNSWQNERALQGFLDGVSWALDLEFWKSGQGITFDQVKYWMDRYCRENPLHHTVQGAIKLFRERAGY